MRDAQSKEELAEQTAAALAAIHEAMESVRFTGRIEFRDGKWVGVYGGSE